MSTVARAILVDRPGQFSVGSAQLPALGRRGVLIRTLFSGVSTGTDKWVMQGRFTWMAMEFPVVPGYQRVGVVEAIGEDVADLELGQQVVATASLPFDNAFPAWGAHVSAAVSDRSEVFDASGISPQRASLFISGQVGFNAASRVIAEPGSRVAVYGDGIIGVSGALAARARGYQVLLVGRHPERLGPVSELGIRTVRSGGDSAAAIREWQPSSLIDTVQNAAAFDEYIVALPDRVGQIVYSGHSPDGATTWADMTILQQRELTTSFVSGWAPDRIEGTLELMRAGGMPLEALVDGPSSGERDMTATMSSVVAGALVPVAAVLDWRGI